MRTISVFACASFLLASSALAAEPAVDGENPLAPLDWIVGRWTSDFQRPSGSPMKVELEYQWAGHRKSMRYTIRFTVDDRSFTQYEGTYWWDPAAKQIRMLQVDAQGNVTQSEVRIEGKTVHQSNVVTRADGSKGEQRVRSVQTGDDEFAFSASILRDGEWVEAVSLTYRRVKDPAK